MPDDLIWYGMQKDGSERAVPTAKHLQSPISGNTGTTFAGP
jgi:hypothetical protein